VKTPWVAALLIVAWAGTAAAEDERTLIEICGRTLSEDTVVRAQGVGGSFGTCTITVAGARLRILQANLRGSALRLTGTGDARLMIAGTRLLADLEVVGDYDLVRIANSLVWASRAVVDLGTGRLVIRFGTFRPAAGEVEVSIGDGSVQVASTRFQGPASLFVQPGGADLRLSELFGGVDVTTLGAGDLAFLSNTVRGPADVRGEGRVVVAANTFELAPDGAGGVAVEGDLAFLNNLVESEVRLQGIFGLMVIGNTFAGGRPTVEGSSLSCIVINNRPRAPCP
jgi:hypothetical protein